MNYIQIMGGLGNQLFQYAFSKYIERYTKNSSILHTGFFDMDFSKPGMTAREFALDKFNTHYAATKDSVTCSRMITDESSDFDPDTDNVFFYGYWQSRDYYLNNLDSLSSELTVKDEYLSDDIKLIGEKIASCESISIHVRRTDYLNGFNKNIFCELTVDYYKAAVKYITDNIKSEPAIFIFSDDHDYIKSNMSDFMGHKTIIIDPHKDYEDLYLMSKAKHHIIANSTFSLWGALLSKNPEGITVAPETWFMDRPTANLYPDNWIRIKNVKEKKKISVIIPAYNVETYVDKCLQSIEEQSYGIDNLEIILINDSSTDNTLLHLQEFEKKHPDQVMLVNLNINGGQGAARNIGLEYSTGDYISFVDSDDFIDICMFEKMVYAMNRYDCDVIECSYRQVRNDSEAYVTTDIDDPLYLDLNDPEDFKQLIVFNCVKTAVWGRLYKKSFIDNNHLRFVEHLFYEDVQFSGLAMFVMKSYFRMNETLYYYRYNDEGTIFSSYQKEKVRQEVYVLEKYLSELYERKMMESILRKNRRNLAVFCISKSFMDPLYLLIRSSLDLKDLLDEIAYFKNNILDLFPDASTDFYLADKSELYKLGFYLLNCEQTITEKLFLNACENKIVIITCGETKDIQGSDRILQSLITDYSDRELVKITKEQYELEHAILNHAIKSEDVIMIVVDKYSGLDDQRQTNQCICSLLSEYNENRIIIQMDSLYYDESDDSLSDLSSVIEAIKNHSDVTIVVPDEATYSIAVAIMPDIHIELSSVILRH